MTREKDQLLVDLFRSHQEKDQLLVDLFSDIPEKDHLLVYFFRPKKARLQGLGLPDDENFDPALNWLTL